MPFEWRHSFHCFELQKFQNILLSDKDFITKNPNFLTLEIKICLKIWVLKFVRITGVFELKEF